MKETFTLCDRAGDRHCLEIQSGRLLVDGVNATIGTITDDIVLFYDNLMTIAIDPTAFWEAIAGTGKAPKFDEMGRLLAYSLACQERLSSFEQMLQVHPLGNVPLPARQLDERSVLSAYDGTRATTLILAHILKVNPEKVAQIAQEYGYSHDKPHAEEHHPPQSEGASIEVALVPQPAAERLTPTKSQLQQLLLAYKEKPTLKAAICSIAGELHATVGSIQGVIYSHKLNEYWKQLHPAPDSPSQKVPRAAEERTTQAENASPPSPASPPSETGTPPTTSELFFREKLEIEGFQALLKQHHIYRERTTAIRETVQCFFDGPYGVSLALIPSEDSTRTHRQTLPPKHASRVWIWGNAAHKSLEIQQNILAEIQQTYSVTCLLDESLTPLFEQPAA